MHFDIVQKILQLIYGGAVEVQATDMRSFVKAAKFLKLQGFENIDTSLSLDDIKGADQPLQIPPREKYQIRLKRIDDDDVAMTTPNGVNDEQFASNSNRSAVTNGGESFVNNVGCSSSSDDSGNGNGNGSNQQPTNESNNVGQNAQNDPLLNIFPLLSSSSSSSAESDYNSSESEMSGKMICYFIIIINFLH